MDKSSPIWRDSSTSFAGIQMPIVASGSNDELIQTSMEEESSDVECTDDSAIVVSSWKQIETKNGVVSKDEKMDEEENIETVEETESEDETESEEEESDEKDENSNEGSNMNVTDADFFYDILTSQFVMRSRNAKRKDVLHEEDKENIKKMRFTIDESSENYKEVENGYKSYPRYVSDSIATSKSTESSGILSPIVCKFEPLVTHKRVLPVSNHIYLKDELKSSKNNQVSPKSLNIKRERFGNETSPKPLRIKQEKLDDSDFLNNMPTMPTLSSKKEPGAKAQATLDREFALTADRLQDLHGSLVDHPSEDTRATDPHGLLVELMPHQQHALAWLLWREQQKPPGGVLADDMGLGKTLTMISLIVVTLSKKRFNNWDLENEYKGGTLVVCPASLLAQWAKEIKTKCEEELLSVELYHGTSRGNLSKRLTNIDVVITTYSILSREYTLVGRSMVYKIRWERVILDEAHVIRNHKSHACEAVCQLLANKRWALTGTPIQNKEMDLYSILKFLRCTPFDDLRVWKRWVDNRDEAGHQRLATVMKSLMLRRTKQELQEKGALGTLPDKSVEEISVQLDPEEQLVYEKVLIYSRTLFAQFLTQREDKRLDGWGFSRPARRKLLARKYKTQQFTKAQNALLSLHADVKTHEILVLLLRLRQICVHPALIHAMLDQEDMQVSGIMDIENISPDILAKVNNLSFESIENSKDKDHDEIGVNTRITGNLLTSKNPVFMSSRLSSKMRAVLNTIEGVLQKNDKLIVVSQWTSVLDVVASHLEMMDDATFRKFTGSVAVKDRQDIVDAFNEPNSDPKILLLSLTAGGVGLNLIGGNHLLLVDIHWNPQLETQVQDRIYRFGQKKNVFIYKFLCKDTIEESIQELQKRKLEIARSVLSGENSSAISKLTLNDLKSLFGLKD